VRSVKNKVSCAVLSGFLLFSAYVAHAQILLTTTETPFPALNGPYEVGTADYLWVDESRAETYSDTPDDKRHLRIKVWYPAKKQDGLTPAPYLPSLNEFKTPELFRGLTALPSRAYANAPIAIDQQNFPVLIYSHGADWTRFSGSFVTEEMASQGYIVVAIGHTGMNKSTRFPGYNFTNDIFKMLQSSMQQAMATKKPEEMKQAQAEMSKYMEDSFAVWTDDVTYVLNKLEALSTTDKMTWSSRLDMKRIGMFGWSFGGALALEMTHQDERVLAGVNHDGGLWGDIVDNGSTRPLMIMHSDWHKDLSDYPAEQREMVGEALSKNEKATSKFTSDWYELDFPNAGHAHFSDITEFANLEFPAFQSMRNQDNPARIHKIIVDYTLAFFNQYLKGQESALLSATAEDYPEIKYQFTPKK